MPASLRATRIQREGQQPTVDVYIGQQKLYNLTAQAAELVSFHFPSDPVSNHSVTQTTYEHPCTFLQQGFSSRPQPEPSSVFSIQLYNELPIFFACMAHCHDGEVGVINPTSNYTIESFAARALQSTPDFSFVPADGSAAGDGKFSAEVVPPPGTPQYAFPGWLLGVAFVAAAALAFLFASIVFLIFRWRNRKRLAAWRAMRGIQHADDVTLVESARMHAARATAML